MAAQEKKLRGGRRRWPWVVLALVVAVGAATWWWLAPPELDPATRRQVTGGTVVGFAGPHDTWAWLGIPFAAPPVGELRWRAPRPVIPWTGVRAATRHGNVCAQPLPLPFSPLFGSEDCLYLDVYAPRLPEGSAERLPVMVWIHGGANTLGAARFTRGFRLAAEGRVLVVAIQYRLGLLGWLSHPALRATAENPLDETANFALLDMVAALSWVRDNAAAFGGDPHNVTIFGQSAGAFDVLALLAVPQAKGLFQRAIAQSGNVQTLPRQLAEHYVDDPQPGLPWSGRELVNRWLVAAGRAADRAEAKALQARLAPEELARWLRGLSVRELIAAAPARGANLGYRAATNIRDGLVLPERSLLEAYADPEGHHRVPVILGSNRDEYRFFFANDERFVERDWFGLVRRPKDPAQYLRLAGYFSDQWRTTGVNEPARALARSQPGEVWTYRFDWADQRPGRFGTDWALLLGAAHGIENTFLFGAEYVSGLARFARPAHPEERAWLEGAMRAYWTTFARTGRPDRGGRADLPQWTPWRADGPNKLILDRPGAGGIRMESDHLAVSDLVARLAVDPGLEAAERCRLYAQLFRHALTRDFFSPRTWERLGCRGDPDAVEPLF
ncbi:MAG: carboxylic ester hydrolase [Porticoccaceae bacterium]|nr:MAG: carboxylic ester hydrolase [Porticoccaceae bacterium]